MDVLVEHKLVLVNLVAACHQQRRSSSYCKASVVRITNRQYGGLKTSSPQAPCMSVIKIIELASMLLAS